VSYDCKSPEDVLKTIKDDKIEMVRSRFADLPVCGSIFGSARALNLDSFAEAFGLRWLLIRRLSKRS